MRLKRWYSPRTSLTRVAYSVTPAELEHIKALRSLGWSLLAISIEVDLSPSTVARLCSKHGFEKGTPNGT